MVQIHNFGGIVHRPNEIGMLISTYCILTLVQSTVHWPCRRNPLINDNHSIVGLALGLDCGCVIVPLSEKYHRPRTEGWQFSEAPSSIRTLSLSRRYSGPTLSPSVPVLQPRSNLLAANRVYGTNCQWCATKGTRTAGGTWSTIIVPDDETSPSWAFGKEVRIQSAFHSTSRSLNRTDFQFPHLQSINYLFTSRTPPHFAGRDASDRNAIER